MGKNCFENFRRLPLKNILQLKKLSVRMWLVRKAKVTLEGGAMKWQNVIFVVKACISVMLSAIHTEDQTRFGSLTSSQLELKLLAEQEHYMFVLPA